MLSRKHYKAIASIIKDNTLLKDIYYETFINDFIYRITFDFLK